MSGGEDRARAESILRDACGDRLRTDFPLGPLTSFRIGGPADLYLEPISDADLAVVAEAVRETAIAVTVIGKGSNVLVSDDGFRGLVLRLGKGFRWTSRDGDHLGAGGAMPLPALAGVALSHALTGLEFGVAIPASLGGAVRMNAGAHGRSMVEVVENVEVFDLEVGEPRSVSPETMGFRYRGSELSDTLVVVGASVGLRAGDPASIRELMDGAREWRRRTQPLAEPNCGSVFKNPPGDHAARLVETAGAKGLSIGAAAVSAKHANFIVTREGARAADVVALIRRVQELVDAQHGVRLEPEVRFVGNFDLAPI